MSLWTKRFEVARWEFQRFVKPKQLVFSFVLMLVMGGVGFSVTRFAKRSQDRPVKVFVVGGEHLRLAEETVGNVTLTNAQPSQVDSLRASLISRDIDGILMVRSSDSASLIVRRNPAWKRTLEAHLAGARQRLRLDQAGLAPASLVGILAPVAVTTEFQSGNDGRLARVAALVAVGLVLYGIFTSMVYLMVSVTAEKQLRVTEQVISAISPQTWIDGKILGIAAVALVNVLIFLAGAALWVLGRSIATGSKFSMGSVEPGALLLIIIFAMLGFLFWLSVFGVVAATIDDPNTSTRGPLMFMPAMFSVAGFLTVPNPDSTFARIAGILPLTSPAVMPARIAMTDVSAWELVLSALVLAGSALVARRAAGRVFSIAMLMYGKEPGWTEIRRWMKET